MKIWWFASGQLSSPLRPYDMSSPASAGDRSAGHLDDRPFEGLRLAGERPSSPTCPCAAAPSLRLFGRRWPREVVLASRTCRVSCFMPSHTTAPCRAYLAQEITSGRLRTSWSVKLRCSRLLQEPAEHETSASWSFAELQLRSSLWPTSSALGCGRRLGLAHRSTWRAGAGTVCRAPPEEGSARVGEVLHPPREELELLTCSITQLLFLGCFCLRAAHIWRGENLQSGCGARHWWRRSCRAARSSPAPTRSRTRGSSLHRVAHLSQPSFMFHVSVGSSHALEFALA